MSYVDTTKKGEYEFYAPPQQTQTPTHPTATPVATPAESDLFMGQKLERKRNYLLAPINPRTYAVLMYFFFWNMIMAILGTTLVNVTFWLSIGLIPLCGVGLGFLVIFSWIWRALCALEVSIINAICPPSTGPIERDALSFSPHLKNPLTWLAVPYWCFFKIIWASMVFAVLLGLYAASIICLASPVFYFFGVGMECPSCNGIWIIFVHLPAGVVLFYLTTVLTLLLGACESEVIKAMNQKRVDKYSGYNETTPFVTKDVTGKETWVIPNTSIVDIAKTGSTGSRCCIGIGCGICLAMTAALAFFLVTGIAVAHCGGWTSSDFNVEVVTVNVPIPDDLTPMIQIDGTNWKDSSSGGIWGGVWSNADITVGTYVPTNESAANTIQFIATSESLGDYYHLDKDTVRSWYSNGTFSPTQQFSWWRQVRSCSSLSIVMNLPKNDYSRGLSVVVHNVDGASITIAPDDLTLNMVQVETKNGDVRVSTAQSSDAPKSPSFTLWSIQTTNGDVNLEPLYSSSQVSVRTTNGNIQGDGIECAGCYFGTTNGYVQLEKFMSRNNTMNTVKTTNGRIFVTAYYTVNTQYNSLTMESTNGRVFLDVYEYYGDFSLKTSNDRASVWVPSSGSEYDPDLTKKSMWVDNQKAGTITPMERRERQPIPGWQPTNTVDLHTTNAFVSFDWES